MIDAALRLDSIQSRIIRLLMMNLLEATIIKKNPELSQILHINMPYLKKINEIKKFFYLFNFMSRGETIR